VRVLKADQGRISLRVHILFMAFVAGRATTGARPGSFHAVRQARSRLAPCLANRSSRSVGRSEAGRALAIAHISESDFSTTTY